MTSIQQQIRHLQQWFNETVTLHEKAECLMEQKRLGRQAIELQQQIGLLMDLLPSTL